MGCIWASRAGNMLIFRQRSWGNTRAMPLDTRRVLVPGIAPIMGGVPVWVPVGHCGGAGGKRKRNKSSWNLSLQCTTAPGLQTLARTTHATCCTQQL